MRRQIWNGFGAIVSGFALLWIGSAVALASPYGSGGYNSCAYSTGCPAPTPTPAPTPAPTTDPTPTPQPEPVTETTLPSGLEVAVNLSNGQVVPSSGYTIVITPLNGQGKTIKKAVFYVDGKEVATEEPGPDGSVKWRYDPKQYPGKVIRVELTDQDGTVTTLEYRISVSDQQPRQHTTTPAATSTGDEPPAAATPLAQIAETTKKVIQALPEPVVIAFPWLLLSLMIGNIILLLIQARRELGARRQLEALLAHEKAVNEAKQNLVQLVSHYMRTPLTLLKNGSELLGSAKLPETTVAAAQAIVLRLQGEVEAVLSSKLSTATNETHIIPRPSIVSRQAVVNLWLPLAGGGLLAFLFVYLANHYSRFPSGTLTVVTQLAVFGMIVLASYQLYRRRELQKQQLRYSQQLLADEQALTQISDEVVETTAALLQKELQELATVMAQIPQGPLTKFIYQGYERMKEVANRFAIATHLKGSQSTDPIVSARLADLQQQAMVTVAPKATAANVSVAPAPDQQLLTRNPALLSLVLRSLLENAVAYSPAQASVSIATQADASQQAVTVSDHGSGIPADKLSELFKPFSKAEGAETFDHEGMGFSLYLDKLIMLHLGGDIAVSSEPGKGTTATFRWSPLPA